MNKNLQQINYDRGWVLLIKEAKKMGLTPIEVRIFIKKVKKRSQYTS